jgi:hypothetical protein
VRAADLSAASLAAIAGMIEHGRRLEGLPHDAASPPPGEREAGAPV